jgi:hypothetical protein
MKKKLMYLHLQKKIDMGKTGNLYQIYQAVHDLYVWIIASPNVGIYRMQASLYL